MGIQTPTPKDQMQFRFPTLVQNNNNEKYVQYEAVFPWLLPLIFNNS